MGHRDGVARRLQHDRGVRQNAAAYEVERSVARMLLVDDALKDHIAAQPLAGFA